MPVSATLYTPLMVRAKAACCALAASFFVYLIPIVGPHTAWLLGQAMFDPQARQDPRWITINICVALGFQFLGAALLYWFFRAVSARRAVPVLVVFLVIITALQPLYVGIIPAMFLEERDTAPEKLAWPVQCTVPGVFQTRLATASELWIRHNNEPNEYAVLTAPDCALAPVTLPKPHLFRGGRVNFMIDVTSVVPYSHGVVQKLETQSGAISWWMVPGFVPLAPPAAHSAATQPILSNDGEWCAWLEPIPGSGPPVLHRVIIRRIMRQKSEIVLELGTGSYFIKTIDVGAQELTLWKDDHLIAMGFDGVLKHEFPRPSVVRPQQSTYIAAGDYWVAWDASREDEPYRLEWWLPSGSGMHRVPLGRTIHGAAVDPSGRFIAVSVGTALNIGSALDSVYILSASDGRELFRKYLPTYTRSPVTFLSNSYFAYSDLSGVHLLRVPN